MYHTHSSNWDRKTLSKQYRPSFKEQSDQGLYSLHTYWQVQIQTVKKKKKNTVSLDHFIKLSQLYTTKAYYGVPLMGRSLTNVFIRPVSLLNGSNDHELLSPEKKIGQQLSYHYFFST